MCIMKPSSVTDITKANEILAENLSEIANVQEWAEAVGYKELSLFSRTYRNCFGMRPKKYMVKLRLDKAIRLLRNNPAISCYEVARAIGKQDEKALHRFFITHGKKTPSYYKLHKASEENH